MADARLFQLGTLVAGAYQITLQAEDAASTVTLDNVNFEVENTDGTQRNIKITSAKAGNTTLTLEEDLTIGDGNAGTITFTGASKTLSVEDTSVVNQDLTTDAGVTFAAITANGVLSMGDNVLSRPEIKDYSESVSAIGSDTTPELDIVNGNVFTDTIDTGETTFTFSNPSASGTACSFTLILTNGGSQTVNWPGAVDWAAGTAPSLTSSGTDVLVFTTIDAGTIWYGFAAGLDVKSP